MLWLSKNIYKTLNAQKTPNSSFSQATYGVSIASISENFDLMTMAPHYMLDGHINHNMLPFK